MVSLRMAARYAVRRRFERSFAALCYLQFFMVKEGYYFGLPPLFFGGISLALHWWIAAAVLIAIAAFCFSFFRDPDRAIPPDPEAVLSPADGRVLVITDEENAGRPGTRISIFLAIWNVHVNRSPAAGVISKLQYCPGKFFAAMREYASTENEQNVISLASESGEIIFKQIAGLIARRVVCWKKPGDRMARGERLGLVRFGSRADLWLPREAEILTKVGDRVKGGASIVAYWPAQPKSTAARREQARVSEEALSPAGK